MSVLYTPVLWNRAKWVYDAVLVAAVASALVTQLCLGSDPIFRLPAYEVRSPLELPLYLGLGLLASGVSLALLRLLAAGRSPRVQRLLGRLPSWSLPALGAWPSA